MPKLSAGLLVYRDPADGELEVLLVHPGGPFWARKDEHAWSIPKGEYPEEADAATEADREFAEELGIPAPSGERLDLGKVRQSSGKIVRAWAIRANNLEIGEVNSNHFEMEWPPKSGQLQSFPEIDRAQWMDLETARRRIVSAQVVFLDRLLELREG